MDLLAAELIDGCRHLIVQLLIKFALLGFIPTTEHAETIKKQSGQDGDAKKETGDRRAQVNQIRADRPWVSRA